MAMIKYGVERIANGEDTITMYKNAEAAQKQAEAYAQEIAQGDSVMLFTAECDENGKLATNEFNVLKVWD